MIKLVNQKEVDKEEKLAKVKETLEKKKEMLINTNVFEDQLFLDKEFNRIEDIVKVNEPNINIKPEIIKDIIKQEIDCKKMLFNNDAAIYFYYNLLAKAEEIDDNNKQEYKNILGNIKAVLKWEENKKEKEQFAKEEDKIL